MFRLPCWFLSIIASLKRYLRIMSRIHCPLKQHAKNTSLRANPTSHWRMLASRSGSILAGYSAGSTGKGQRDTRRDPLASYSGTLSGILGGIHWRAALVGSSAGSTGELLWRDTWRDAQSDTRLDPLASCSDCLAGLQAWQACQGSSLATLQGLQFGRPAWQWSCKEAGLRGLQFAGQAVDLQALQGCKLGRLARAALQGCKLGGLARAAALRLCKGCSLADLTGSGDARRLLCKDCSLVGYSAGFTGETLWRDTQRDPLASCSGGILGGIHWQAALAGYSGGSSRSGGKLGGEPLWRDTGRDPLASSSGGILGGIHWRAALAAFSERSTGELLWRDTQRDPLASIANADADSNIKSNNPFLSGRQKHIALGKWKLLPPDRKDT